MIRPTLRAALLFALAPPFAFLVLAFNKGLWIYALDPGLLLIACVWVDAALGAPSRRVSVELRGPARIYVGGTADLVVAIAQRGRARARRFEVLGEWTGPVDPPSAIEVAAGEDGAALAPMPIAAGRRGVIAIDAVWLRWRGPLGLSERLRRTPLEKRIEILPDVRSIQANALQFVTREAIDGVKVQTQRGEGAEFESLRDHVPGLDNRFIDWKQSAKHRKLLSKEFRIERNHQVVLAYDTGRLMCEPLGDLTRLDHALHAGLQLGWVSLRHGDFVGAFGFDARVRQFVQPARGPRYFQQLQRGASALAYNSEETNYTLGLAELNARLKRRALVILFTEFVDTTTAQLLLDSIQRMANRHAVVFVTLRDSVLADAVDAPPRDFRAVAEALVARDFARERAVVLERLQRMGVHCLEAPPRGLAVGLVNRYLALKQRGLL
jgi:uncharacterized protein (DUF58 family)